MSQVLLQAFVGLFYQVGTHIVFDFGEYAFEQFVKHVEYYVFKIPIRFPSLLHGILSSQNNDIMMNVGHYYTKLVKEFVVNLSSGFNDVESYAIKTPIGFPSLIYGILSYQKNGIVISEDDVGATPSILNFNYKCFGGKHVGDIATPNIIAIDETD